VKAKIQNVTLSLPELRLRKFRVYAAERNKSALMTEAIRRMLDEQDSQEAAKRRLLERIHNAPNRGPGGTISWTRDEIYER